MSLSPQVLLIVYVMTIFVVAVVGGRISELGTMTHMRMQIVISFVAGFILGIGLFHLVPHAIESINEPHSVELAILWVVIGIVVVVILLRVFNFHHHEPGGEHPPHDHQINEKTGVISVVFGLVLHSVTEGAALGASVRLGDVDGSLLPGLGVCFAILLHKPLDTYSIVGMMDHAGHTKLTRQTISVAYALVCPVVALATYYGSSLLGPISTGNYIGFALAFAAGTFLCISLSDLLPEIQFHRHDRLPLLAALLVGIGLAYCLYLMEASHAAH